MGVKHVLKGGKTLSDITGHVVKSEENEALYEAIQRINQKRGQKWKKEKERTDC